MAVATKQQLPLLHSDNWAHWQKVLFAVLIKDELWSVVCGEKMQPADDAAATLTAFCKKQAKAVSLLVPSISEQLNHLIPAWPSDPKVVWDGLVRRFESKSEFNIITIETKLHKLSPHGKWEPLAMDEKAICPVQAIECTQ